MRYTAEERLADFAVTSRCTAHRRASTDTRRRTTAGPGDSSSSSGNPSESLGSSSPLMTMLNSSSNQSSGHCHRRRQTVARVVQARGATPQMRCPNRPRVTSNQQRSRRPMWSFGWRASGAERHEICRLHWRPRRPTPTNGSAPGVAISKPPRTARRTWVRAGPCTASRSRSARFRGRCSNPEGVCRDHAAPRGARSPVCQSGKLDVCLANGVWSALAWFFGTLDR